MIVAMSAGIGGTMLGIVKGIEEAAVVAAGAGMCHTFLYNLVLIIRTNLLKYCS